MTELPRHSHAGPAVAERCMQALRTATERARSVRSADSTLEVP